VSNELGALIASDIASAEDDLARMRSSALNLVGVSGGLVTLTTGVVAVAGRAQTETLRSWGPRGVLIAGLLSYVAAGIVALRVNRPADLEMADATELERFARANWDDEGWDQQVAIVRAKYLARLRSVNEEVAKGYAASIGLTIAGIAFTVIVAASLLLST
jgi:hypothetical protein